MKNSVIILAVFSCGVLFGLWAADLINFDFSMIALYLLMFLVGISIGADSETWQKIRKLNAKILLVPLSVIIGTFIGVFMVSFLIRDISPRYALAIGAGFGYYSLSSVIIASISGKALGVVALLTNISREVFTLIATPLLCRYFGKLAPIASAGATSMDTTLPGIMKFSGKDYAIISIFNGIILTILVPFLIAVIL